MKCYEIYVLNKNGEQFRTSVECKGSKKATLHFLREWAKKYGHTLLEETYIEYEIDDDPAFVEACLADIAGFKR